MRKINPLIISMILILFGFIYSPSKADWTSQISGVPSTSLIYPSVSLSFIGFDFTGYIYPNDLNGTPYTQTSIISKTAFKNSPIAFEVPSSSVTASFIASAMPSTSANLVIGLVDDEGNEFTINADVIDNTNVNNNYIVKTDDIPGGVSEGLATILTANGDTEIAIEKMHIFISQTVADKNSYDSALAPEFNTIIPILNRAKKTGELYYTGTKLPSKALIDGMAILVASKTALMKNTLLPATSFIARPPVTYNYNEVSRQLICVKDTTSAGTAIAVVVSLFGVDLIEFPIPTCTTTCGDEL